MADRAIITVALDGNPQDTTELGDFFVFRVSDITRFLSAIVQGAATSYPEAYEQLVQEAVPIMDICEQVADCIDTSADVQNALQMWLNQATPPYNPYTPATGQPVPDEVMNGNLVVNPEDCDKDALWGAIKNLIEGMNRNNTDAIEIMVGQANFTEAAEKLIAAIPVVGIFPIDEVFGLVNMISEFIANNYEAQYTGSLETEYMCDLFCIAQDACDFTPELVYQYFQDRLEFYYEGFATVNSLALMLSLIGEIPTGILLPGSIVVDLMFWIQSGLLKYANGFLGGVNITYIQNLFRIGAGLPDNDWQYLCEACATPPDGWAWIINFSESQQGSGTGSWSYGLGWSTVLVNDSSTRRQLVIGWSTLTNFELTRIQYVYGWLKGSFDANVGALILRQNNTIVQQVNANDMPASGTLTQTYDESPTTANQVSFTIQAGRAPLSTDPGGSANLLYGQLEGTGLRPDWVVGKGYPVDADCSIWDFRNGLGDWYIDPGKNGAQDATNGITQTVSTATSGGLYFSGGAIILQSSVAFPFYGFNVKWKGTRGETNSTATSIAFQFVCFDAVNNEVYRSQTLGINNLASYTNSVAYTDKLITRVVISIQVAQNANRATLLATPGTLSLLTVLLRHGGAPSWTAESTC